MIPNKSNKTLVAEVPYSSINVQGYDIPYYTVPQCYCDAFIGSDYDDSKFPFFLTGTTERFPIFIKVLTTFQSTAPYLRVTSVKSGSTVYGVSMQSMGTYNGFSYWYEYIDEVPYHTEVTDLYYEINIYPSSSSTSPLFTSWAKQVIPSTVDKYIYFAYNNYEGGRKNGFDWSDWASTSGFRYMVVGGVKPAGHTFDIQQTTFRNQRYDPSILSANSRDIWTITVGDGRGVPEYVGTYINRILACDTVYINGRKVVRSGDVVPQPIEVGGSSPFVNYTFDVEIIPTEPTSYSPNTF